MAIVGRPIVFTDTLANILVQPAPIGAIAQVSNAPSSRNGELVVFDGTNWNYMHKIPPVRPPDIASNIHFWDLTGVISTRTTTSVTDEGLANNGHDLSTYSGTITTTSIGSQGRTGIAYQNGNTGQMENASARPWSGVNDGTLMAVFYNFARIGSNYSHVMHMGGANVRLAMGIVYNFVDDKWGTHRWSGNEPNAADSGLIEGVNSQLMVLFTRYNSSTNEANFRAYVNKSPSANINTTQTVAGGSINITYGDGVKVSSRVGGVNVEPGQFNGCSVATFNAYVSDSDCDDLAAGAAFDYG